jgi:molybdate transport system substrate-binding protein
MVRRVLVLAFVLALTGCGGSSASSGTVTVFAAASLTESFTQIGKDFEAANSGVTVKFNFAGSSALAQQIGQGAPADVFASASPATMKQVSRTSTVFVRNQLVIAVPKGNPKGITKLADLTRPGLKVALCAGQVPCGAAASKALAAAGAAVKPATLEQDVKAALSKVKLGEVDAALVYRTDAIAAKSDVDGVEFPESAKAVNDYPIAALTDEGKTFVSYVLSDKALSVLTAAGFQKP